MSTERKREALGMLKGMLRKGSGQGYSDPMNDERDETDKQDPSVSNLVKPDHDVGDVKDQSEAHPRVGKPEMASHESDAPMAPPEVKGGGQKALPAPGPASGGKGNPKGVSDQTKPGSSGPGWRESDSGHGASELRARADGAGRSAAQEEDSPESKGLDLVAGLVHVAKKFNTP